MLPTASQTSAMEKPSPRCCCSRRRKNRKKNPFTTKQLVSDIKFVFRCGGSVIPQALILAVPMGLVSSGLHQALENVTKDTLEMDQEWQLWSSFTFVLGFLVVFRTNQAYSRYWEGATLLQQVKGEWFNATSSVVAFCTDDKAKLEDVRHLQHHLVRLISMLYCAALQTVAMVPDERMNIMDVEGLEIESMDFLNSDVDRCEVVLQWVQRRIVDGMREGLIDVPAPILSRVFQELSRGIVNVRNVQKIAEIPFPFPYTQMILVSLFVHTIMTTVFAAVACTSSLYAGCLTFITVLAFWCMNFIAAEIEQPFGEDFNDLPIADMMNGMNNSLQTLLMEETQNYPKFEPPQGARGLMGQVRTSRCSEVNYGSTGRISTRRMENFAKPRVTRISSEDSVSLRHTSSGASSRRRLSQNSLEPASERSRFSSEITRQTGPLEALMESDDYDLGEFMQQIKLSASPSVSLCPSFEASPKMSLVDPTSSTSRQDLIAAEALQGSPCNLADSFARQTSPRSAASSGFRHHSRSKSVSHPPPLPNGQLQAPAFQLHLAQQEAAADASSAAVSGAGLSIGSSEAELSRVDDDLIISAAPDVYQRTGSCQV